MPQRYVAATKKWLEHFVIKHNLCPFASKVYFSDHVRYSTIEETERHKQLLSFWNEVIFLDNHPSVATSLLIFPSLDRFEDYLLIYYAAEELLDEKDYNVHYQLASFHPEYIFQDEGDNTSSNFTNRSPYPILHILRTEQVTEAIDHYPEVDQIPTLNINKMKEIGGEKLLATMEFFKSVK